MNTSQLIAKLIAHYGNPLAVNCAARSLWLADDNRRITMKIDALWQLYYQLPETSK